MDTTSDQFLSAAKAIFKQVFKGFGNSKEVENAIYLGSTDPGQWSPKAILVVHKEGCLPDKYYYPQFSNRWDIAEKRLSDLIGREAYFEEINGAVSALYFV